jgi:hypothetical protein
MANTPQSADNGDLQFQRDIDEVFSRANPNPNRVGCPPYETLVRLARREQPIGDPAYEHLAKCSPCFREFRALQAQSVNTAAAPSRADRRLMVAGVAAGLALAVAAGWWFTRDVGRSPSPQNVSTSSADLRTEVDLRRFAVLRSEQAPADVEPVSLPAGVVELTLLLPVGSEPGAYDVQVLDSDLRSQTEAAGNGAIENFVTTLRVRVDLGRLKPGRYQLAVRRQGDSWRMFPATVR